MQFLLKAFLALLLAHILTDFVLQTSRIAEQKKQGRPRGYIEHGLVHYLTACLFSGFVYLEWLASLQFQLTILGLTVAHLLLDWAKISLTRKGMLSDTALTFLLDQIVHVSTVGGAAWVIARPPSNELLEQITWLRSHDSNILLLLVVYTGVIFGGGSLVRYATKPLLGDESPMPTERADQLRNAGMYIGWLERFLVLTALLLQSPATIGLIITAKSIVRYPELKSVRFAEYFLIGTFLSIGIAILGGIILLTAFHGTATLPK